MEGLEFRRIIKWEPTNQYNDSVYNTNITSHFNFDKYGGFSNVGHSRRLVRNQIKPFHDEANIYGVYEFDKETHALKLDNSSATNPEKNNYIEF